MAGLGPGSATPKKPALQPLRHGDHAVLAAPVVLVPLPFRLSKWQRRIRVANMGARYVGRGKWIREPLWLSHPAFAAHQLLVWRDHKHLLGRRTPSYSTATAANAHTTTALAVEL